MEEHQATFEVETRSDAHAVEKLLGKLYDALREESRSLRDETDDSTEMLAAFEQLRDEARNHRPGELRLIYETRDGELKR